MVPRMGTKSSVSLQAIFLIEKYLPVHHYMNVVASSSRYQVGNMQIPNSLLRYEAHAGTSILC
jgi:hypothetical protein